MVPFATLLSPETVVQSPAAQPPPATLSLPVAIVRCVAADGLRLCGARAVAGPYGFLMYCHEHAHLLD